MKGRVCLVFVLPRGGEEYVSLCYCLGDSGRPDQKFGPGDF